MRLPPVRSPAAPRAAIDMQRIQALEAAGTLASDPEARVAYAKAHFATT